jgi:hypothetical protein
VAAADPGGDLRRILRGLRQQARGMLFFLVSFLPSEEPGALRWHCTGVVFFFMLENLSALPRCFCV